MNEQLHERRRAGAQRRSAWGTLLLTTAVCLLASGTPPASQDAAGQGERSTRALEETRLTMGKWIETQQIISKERKEWQQGKEILLGRIELVHKELSGLDEKIQAAQSSVDAADARRDALLAEKAVLEAAGAQLTEAVSRLEVEVRRLFRSLPEPLKTKLAPLYQRIPEDPAATKVSVAERFQSVLGILNALNAANNEITVEYEVRELAGGGLSEVRALYVGLAQAYYVSARDEAGIGRPTPDGWTWEPSTAIASDVRTALEILEGKHTPAFVPLPVSIQ